MLPTSGNTALMMDALKRLDVDETTWRNIPEDSYLHNRRRENLKSYLHKRSQTLDLLHQ
jgi:hypothetical protein